MISVSLPICNLNPADRIGRKEINNNEGDEILAQIMGTDKKLLYYVGNNVQFVVDSRMITFETFYDVITEEMHDHDHL